MAEEIHGPSFSKLITSDLFTFVLGEEKTEVIVHSHAIATISEPLRALVQGDMVEAKSRRAELQNIEADDFIRFLEYAYRRDYTIPDWVNDEIVGCGESTDGEAEAPLSKEPAPEDAPALELSFDIVAPDYYPRKKKSRKAVSVPIKDRQALRSSFQKRKYISESLPNAQLLEDCRPKQNSGRHQDFSRVLLSHARLYTFADMYLIAPLKELTLQKLHQTLLAFQLYHQRVGDIVKLARYAYQNGHDRLEDGALDDLRQLVVEYIACEVDNIGKHKVFREFMEEGGEFVSDFWDLAMGYLLV